MKPAKLIFALELINKKRGSLEVSVSFQLHPKGIPVPISGEGCRHTPGGWRKPEQNHNKAKKIGAPHFDRHSRVPARHNDFRHFSAARSVEYIFIVPQESGRELF